MHYIEGSLRFKSSPLQRGARTGERPGFSPKLSRALRLAARWSAKKIVIVRVVRCPLGAAPWKQAVAAVRLNLSLLVSIP